MSLLSVKNLTIAFHTRNGSNTAVARSSFDVQEGEVLGIVGESGSGKSITCYSLLGLIPMPPGKIENGSAIFEGQDLLRMNEKALREVRGNHISMIFQDPMTSLNPHMRIGKQIVEPLKAHASKNNTRYSEADLKERAIKALDEVGIPNPEARYRDYPHQFSGGMRQRVMIAMALISEPKLLIADEPTTALDVTVQKQILDLLSSIQKKRSLSIIFITHDLGLIKGIADRVLVMEKGHIVEQGECHSLFDNPQHPYTQKLISAIPTSAKRDNFTASSKAPYLSVKNLVTRFSIPGSFMQKEKQYIDAVKDFNLDIFQGEIMGLVGESGSGKSTLGRSIIRLVDSSSGQVLLENQNLLAMDDKAFNIKRRDIQMIFQDPYGSLNPRKTVFDTLAEPLLYHKLESKSSVLARVLSLMDDVGLDRQFIKKYPHEFSGGQRQRIAIARALALNPKLIVADEPVSALDVTIQAQILDLLLDITKRHSLTMLFISHDLSVVRYLCDRVAVMRYGELIELNDTETLYAKPQHEYTRNLLAAVPEVIRESVS